MRNVLGVTSWASSNLIFNKYVLFSYSFFYMERVYIIKKERVRVCMRERSVLVRQISKTREIDVCRGKVYTCT